MRANFLGMTTLGCGGGEVLKYLGADGLGGGEVAAAEIVARLSEVGSDLRAKFGGPGKFSLVPQPFPEAHLEPALGYLPRKIEEVAFHAQ